MSRGLAYLDRLLEQGGDDPELLKSAAGAYLKIGDAQGGLGHANLGDTPGATASYGKALAVATKWNSLQPASPDAHASIGDCTERQANMMQLSGKTDEALLQYRKSARRLREAVGGRSGERYVGATAGCDPDEDGRHPDDAR